MFFHRPACPDFASDRRTTCRASTSTKTACRGAQPPDWLYKLLTTPLPALPSPFPPQSGGGPAPYGTLFNPVRSYPTIDQNVRAMGDARAYVPGITPPPAPSAVEGPDAEQWPSVDAPKPPADTDPRDAAMPDAQPAFDGPQPASDRTVDPNIVRVADGEPAVNDEVQIAQQQGTPQPKLGKDPSPGVVVVLPDGSTIPDPGSPTGQVMSPVADLQTVAAKGREAGATFREMRKNPMTRAGASAYMSATLGLNVGQGGTFDHQRSGNMLTGYTQFYHFRPIANVNVGVFAQQAGLTLEETLDIAGLYARNFSRNSDPSKPHGLDPKTLHYITVGYKIGQNGVFDPPRTP
jgi:hypothetical protein